MEVMQLSETSLEAQERHAEMLLRMEAERRARRMVVPTDPEQVKLRLRELGHPICLFGEDVAMRRDRLKQVLATAELVGDMEAKAAAPSAAATSEKGGKEDSELFYTPGTPALSAARAAIAAFSFGRAAERLRLEREEIADSRAVDARAATLYAGLKTATVQASQVGDDRPLSSCTFTDSGCIVTSGWSGTLKVWDAATCSHVATMRGHTERVSGTAYRHGSQSGVNLASGAADGALNLWSLPASTASSTSSASGVPSIAPSASLVGHVGRVSRVAFHPSGDFLGSTGYDKTWRLWDVATQKELLLQEGHAREAYALAFQSDGALLASGDLGGIGRVWDLRSGKSIMTIKSHVRQLIALSFSPNGFTLATGSDDNTSVVWDLRQRRVLYTLLAHSGVVSNVKFSPVSGEYLATSSFDGTVKVWCARDWSKVAEFQTHESKTTDFDISADERTIVCCGYDKTIKIVTSLAVR